ncbi:hypothetical protein EVAR_100866_1 [Eumeta japonica]|uniref:Uncharacterized protein n=1 Tax=Eumeta variegata TaxID=151549 RepID=A0A4C1SA76_EUMVA|nr:hypothetical protein EVAR_100866_1 [Eumeta japonica]
MLACLRVDARAGADAQSYVRVDASACVYSAEPNRIIYELAKSQCPVKLDVLGFNISASYKSPGSLSAGRAGGFARNEISLCIGPICIRVAG